MSAVANATYPSRNTFGSNFFICFLQHFWSLNPAGQDSAALTRSGVMGSSRRRRPVAWAKALARAAEVGGSEPSPAPSDGSLRSIRTMSILGTSGNVRTGYPDQSRLVISLLSKATCSFRVRLTAWTIPPSSWFFAPSGLTTSPISAAITTRGTLMTPLLRSTSTSTTAAAYIPMLLYRQNARPRPRWPSPLLPDVHPALSAAARSTACARGSLRWARRNARGSLPAACASSSMKDSMAKMLPCDPSVRNDPLRTGASSSRWLRISFRGNSYEGTALRSPSPNGWGMRGAGDLTKGVFKSQAARRLTPPGCPGRIAWLLLQTSYDQSTILPSDPSAASTFIAIPGPKGAQANSSSRIHCSLTGAPRTARATNAVSSATSSAPLCPEHPAP